MNLKRIKNWDKSYKNRDNYIFYPHEEIIRFISKYIRKRVGLNEFTYIDNNSPKVLDIGFLVDMRVCVILSLTE